MSRILLMDMLLTMGAPSGHSGPGTKKERQLCHHEGQGWVSKVF